MFRTRYILLFSLLISSLITPCANADIYLAFAPAQIPIKTSTGSTKPLVADLRLGYEYDIHKFELAIMSSLKDDNLNELVTDISSATSLLYRYDLNAGSSLSIDFILGYSQINIESSYVQVEPFSETFEGISYGIGFEEAFKSIPKLKLKMDFIQLYRGNELKINTFSLGLRYVF